MITVDRTLAAGTWVGDPVHSDISFKVRHMGVGKVRGTFALASAALSVGEGGGRVTALIDPASVRTGNEQRDQHIRSADFLDVEKYRQIEFASTEVRGFDGETFILVGELTLHGVTRTVEMEAEYLGVVDDPSGAQRTGFSARTTISRAAFGVDIQLGFGAGNAVVADTIEIAIEIEFTTTESDPR
ncbi:YceI family protein [Nonomuraea sp. KC401]|uniref:YceI family protein n=1 Tax=unclassified Nonomuraea TaxID=2593643 RepID=UPI0010FF3F16|nr:MULTISPECIES: YceI family protein [unclassified Nonomuraea]NBE93857.1 polyisoprenoid-binding protein [Nonomuraea sp. K271]TLF68473.1 YceI family protein [Nonomuraea sp. KC401]